MGENGIITQFSEAVEQESKAADDGEGMAVKRIVKEFETFLQDRFVSHRIFRQLFHELQHDLYDPFGKGRREFLIQEFEDDVEHDIEGSLAFGKIVVQPEVADEDIGELFDDHIPVSVRMVEFGKELLCFFPDAEVAI